MSSEEQSGLEYQSESNENGNDGYVLNSRDYSNHHDKNISPDLTNNLIAQVYSGLCEEYPLGEINKEFAEEKEAISGTIMSAIILSPFYFSFLYFLWNADGRIGEKIVYMIMGSLIAVAFGCIISLMAREVCSFKWVHRWMSKWKKYQPLPVMKQHYENAFKHLDNESFQHQYMAHIQVHSKYYNSIKHELTEKLGLEDFLVKTLETELLSLKEYQTMLINNFTWKQTYANVNIIRQIEAIFQRIQSNINNREGYIQQKEGFITRYQDFLQKNNLEYTEDEEIQTPESEDQRQMNQKLKKAL
jgi:adenylate kinase family enzyme